MAPTLKQIRTAHQRMLARCVRTPTGCLEYQGARTGSGGYAVIRIGQRVMRGSHIAWLATHGRILAGKFVLHGCDNPPCVEIGPEHLHLGTHQQNMDEMRARRRSAAGERCAAARLSDAQADEIRFRYLTEGTLQRELAADYGVDQPTISRIIARRTYAA